MAIIRYVALLIFAFLSASSGQARSSGPAFMPGEVPADAPAGFTEMCARDRILCMLGQSSDATVAAQTRTSGPSHFPDLKTGAALPPHDRDLWVKPVRLANGLETTDDRLPAEPYDLRALIKAVNSDVNRHVTQMTDMASMGVDEYWRRLPADHLIGDCEDIAIEKRVRLTEAGFPADHMFYGVAFVRNMGLHTVLIVRLSDGDYILDSMTPHILRWDEPHYVWLRKQVPGAPLQWQRVDRNTVAQNLGTAAGNTSIYNPAS